jgi:hypothetical protein
MCFGAGDVGIIDECRTYLFVNALIMSIMNSIFPVFKVNFGVSLFH